MNAIKITFELVSYLVILNGVIRENFQKLSIFIFFLHDICAKYIDISKKTWADLFNVSYIIHPFIRKIFVLSNIASQALLFLRLLQSMVELIFAFGQNSLAMKKSYLSFYFPIKMLSCLLSDCLIFKHQPWLIYSTQIIESNSKIY